MHRLLHRQRMGRRLLMLMMRLRLLVVAGPLGDPPTVTTAHSCSKHLAYERKVAVGRGWRVELGRDGAIGLRILARGGDRHILCVIFSVRREARDFHENASGLRTLQHGSLRSPVPRPTSSADWLTAE